MIYAPHVREWPANGTGWPAEQASINCSDERAFERDTGTALGLGTKGGLTLKAHSTPPIVRSLDRQADSMWITAADHACDSPMAASIVRGGAVGGCLTA